MNRSALICTLVISLSVHSFAQQSDTLVKTSQDIFELMDILNPWLHTENPAGMQFNPGISISNLSLNFNRIDGDYRRAMDGDTLQKYFLNTTSYTTVGKTMLFGSFSYKKSYERNCNFTQLNDPYRQTPYRLIDTMQRDDVYDREFFNLRGGISSPFARNFSWGISLNMDVGLAAQDRDPRPRNKVLNMDLAPGILFTSGILSIGINMQYSYYNEDIESDVIEKNVQHAFFQLHGLDTYTRHVAASFYRLYERTTLGGEGQFGLNTNHFKSIMGGQILFVDEMAKDGRKAGDASWSYLKDDSRLLGNSYRVFNATTFNHGRYYHHLKASYTSNYILGSEIIQRLEQVGMKGAVNWVDYGPEEKYGSTQTDLKINYTFLLMKEKYLENLVLRLGMNQHSLEEIYRLPDMEQSFSNRTFSTSVQRSFYMGRHTLAIGAGVSTRKNLSGTLDAARENFLTRYLVQPDFNYHTSDASGFWFDAGYSVELNRLFDKFYAGLRAGAYRSEDQKERQHFNINTGVIF